MKVTNPLAGIEVMAGILKRQLLDSPDAQSILGDIIKQATAPAFRPVSGRRGPS